MHQKFRMMTVFLVLFLGVLFVASQSQAATPMAEPSGLRSKAIGQSDTKVFRIAQSKQTDKSGTVGCEGALEMAQAVAKKAEAAAEKATEATDNARRAGEASALNSSIPKLLINDNV